ncbi:hypothetical protein D3C73_1036100 [compost metagenome]
MAAIRYRAQRCCAAYAGPGFRSAGARRAMRPEAAVPVDPGAAANAPVRCPAQATRGSYARSTPCCAATAAIARTARPGDPGEPTPWAAITPAIDNTVTRSAPPPVPCLPGRGADCAPRQTQPPFAGPRRSARTASDTTAPPWPSPRRDRPGDSTSPALGAATRTHQNRADHRPAEYAFQITPSASLAIQVHDHGNHCCRFKCRTRTLPSGATVVPKVICRPLLSSTSRLYSR